jgi:hypothetical protein
MLGSTVGHVSTLILGAHFAMRPAHVDRNWLHYFWPYALYSPEALEVVPDVLLEFLRRNLPVVVWEERPTWKHEMFVEPLFDGGYCVWTPPYCSHVFSHHEEFFIRTTGLPSTSCIDLKRLP